MIPELLFILTVSAAMLLVLFDKFVELVAAATVVLAVVLAVDAVGPSPYMALLFLVVAMTFRMLATVITAIVDMDVDWDLAVAVDELLSDDPGTQDERTIRNDD